MRKNYFQWVLALALTFVMQGMVAQSMWTTHSTSAPKVETVGVKNTTAGAVYLGYCLYEDQIWPYDGLSLDRDARVGVGIKLTRDKLEHYIGGKITGMRCGWDDEASVSIYNTFVREGNFNNADLATGKNTVRFGWNEIEFDEPIVIGDVDTLCVGFYTDIKKGVCSIPKLYPTMVPNSAFLFHGELSEDGKEIWYDSRDLGVMPILLVVTDETGQFKDLIQISGLRHDAIVASGMDVPGVFSLTNIGSNNIESVEVTTTLGEQTMSTSVNLSKTILSGVTTKVSLPIYCFGSGEYKVSITKVNGVVPKNVPEKTFNMLGVPAEVAEKYTHRPLIEFFASENSYHIPTYFDSYFLGGYEAYKDRMNVVCQHTDDKFMIGDPDESILLQLGLVNNDSMQVFLPDMAINRSAYISNPAYTEGNPMHRSILYPTPFQEEYYEDVIAHPTFASVNVNAALSADGKKVNIEVNGNIAENVLPAGEPMFLTVYLLENEVESTDQKFWDDKEGEIMGNKYVHYNVIRENLTPLWGKKLPNASGNYSLSFQTDVYDDYNPKKLSVMAFLNRGEQNSNMERQIINSTEAPVLAEGGETAIDGVQVDQTTVGAPVFYDLGGRRVLTPVKGGLYIKNGQKVILK
ncbi:MAG: Omp28-related outer membrane protein [Bacteroidaceae bacterium]|nr:Omp28-related outer membrane protein [Bacteroidaceae bacterium]